MSEGWDPGPRYSFRDSRVGLGIGAFKYPPGLSHVAAHKKPWNRGQDTPGMLISNSLEGPLSGLCLSSPGSNLAHLGLLL